VILFCILFVQDRYFDPVESFENRSYDEYTDRMMSTLTVHCQWEDETVRETTGYPLSYAEAKKMTPRNHGCPRAILSVIRNFLIN